MLISFDGPIRIIPEVYPGRLVIEIDDTSFHEGSLKPSPECGVFLTTNLGSKRTRIPCKRTKGRVLYEVPLEHNKDGYHTREVLTVTSYRAGMTTLTYVGVLSEYRPRRWSFSYTRTGDGVATTVAIPPMPKRK